MIKDLQEGRITENVKYYAFNKLADCQPIALSEMPLKYLTSGNGRSSSGKRRFVMTRG